MDDANTGVYDDLGEGSVWRRLYPTVAELPVGYSALRTSDLSPQAWALAPALALVQSLALALALALTLTLTLRPT